MGAKFLKIDLGETGETNNGYAKQLTEQQLDKQREMMAKACQNADIVITTAQVFGKKAPLIITEDMVSSMKQGAVIIDLAVETGGNVAGSKLNEVVEKNGVKICGYPQLAQHVAKHASEMYAANIYHLMSDIFDPETKQFKTEDNEIFSAILTTKNGEIVHSLFQSKQEKESK